ncbi:MULTISPECIES: hypothetical protein [unclassified Amycolatopsis]|uniref:hypothetical protein n=1 Tax=unclassified Amycolatopsis TaxID=2618356 RepID=UPI002875CD65|nr:MULTISPECIES: hypothetical protein [unclassified Amycolatopsis]MDS0137776.1 hypothetical protein [Amycolatopsis sp. 505]MDS0141970.1 hypothetical protein [Amycolatopsis sp. CM201R]
MSKLDFLDRVMSDINRTNNARELMKSGAKAIGYIAFSVGVVLAIIISVASVMIRYSSVGLLAGSVLVTGSTTCVAGITWIGRAYLRKRRKQRSAEAE